MPEASPHGDDKRARNKEGELCHHQGWTGLDDNRSGQLDPSAQLSARQPGIRWSSSLLALKECLSLALGPGREVVDRLDGHVGVMHQGKQHRRLGCAEGMFVHGVGKVVLTEGGTQQLAQARQRTREARLGHFTETLRQMHRECADITVVGAGRRARVSRTSCSACPRCCRY